MTVGRCLLLSGFVCLVIVVLTHVAEMLNVFPGMGWGLPDSPGHYLDLVSAVLGCILLIVSIIVGCSPPQPRLIAALWRSASRESHRRRPQQACDQNADGDVIANVHGSVPALSRI